MKKTTSICALLFILATWARPGIAQERLPAQQDSVVVLLRQLLQRLDSLERIIADLRAAQQDTTEAADELAALRAAARAAADEATPAAEQTGDQGSRTRNLNVLNPEISVSGDIVGNFAAPPGEENTLGATPREFEFSFQAALDPYTHMKIFVAREQDFAIAGLEEGAPVFDNGSEGEEEETKTFEIEEGYMYWVGLPGGFGAKVGKFRQEIGLYNRWHTHALLDVERPLASTTFLGEDGLIQTGAAITLPTFTFGPATQAVVFEVTSGSNGALFDGGNDLSYLGRLQNFWDLSPSAFLQLGATGVIGHNDETGLDSKLLGFDLHFRWRPGGAQPFRDLQIKSEWMFADRDEGPQNFTGHGGYVQANYRFNQRWIVGSRFDHLDPFVGPAVVQFVPSITWWQSEWVRIRLQLNALTPEGSSTNYTALLQFVWAAGPHKHETY